jgi:Holliday junction resolvase RusA-like endonuclease
MIQFTVFGTPIPKGSTRSFACRRKVNNAWVYTGQTTNQQSNLSNLRPWEALIRDAAIQAGIKPVSSAVIVNINFHFRRPKNHFGSGRNSNIIKPTAPVHHIQTPDKDKLERAVLDGLAGVVYLNDAQVVDGRVSKSWLYSPYAESKACIEVEYL